MDTGNQYQADLKRLAELVNKHTGIPKTRVAAYIAENGASRLYTSSYALIKTNEEFQKLSALFEFMSLYDNLRNTEKSHVINTTGNAREYFTNFYENKQDKEYLTVAYQDVQFNVIKTKVMSEGTLGEAPIFPREILKEALFTNAQSVIVSHNHPGNTARVSHDDIEATRELARRLNAADIILNDHIIVIGRKAISFAESGLQLGEKSGHFRVSEPVITGQRQAVKKLSVHEQIKANKAEIAQKNKNPSKTEIISKKPASLDI